MNPILGLLRSRKFMLLLLDLVVSTTIYFVGKYAGASAFEDVKMIIGVMQPVFIAGIGAIAYEDGANVKAGAAVQAAEENAKAFCPPEG